MQDFFKNFLEKFFLVFVEFLRRGVSRRRIAKTLSFLGKRFFVMLFISWNRGSLPAPSTRLGEQGVLLRIGRFVLKWCF